MGCAVSGQEVSVDHVQPQFSDRYSLDNMLGKGSTCIVYAATRLSGQTRIRPGLSLSAVADRFAAKVIDLSACTRLDHRDRACQILGEVKVWQALRTHENCVRLVEAFFDGTRAHFVMDLCQCPLSAWLLRFPISTEAYASQMCSEMLAGIGHMHANNAVHCDVKPENFLIAPDGETVQLCDFGLARFLEPSFGFRAKGVVGTAPFMSPEMLLDANFGSKTDVWSLGSTLYFLFYGTWAYAPFSIIPEEMKAAIRSGDPLPTFAKRRSCCSTSLMEPSRLLADFVKALLDRDEERRPSSREAKGFGFFRSIEVFSARSHPESSSPDTSDLVRKAATSARGGVGYPHCDRLSAPQTKFQDGDYVDKVFSDRTISSFSTDDTEDSGFGEAGLDAILERKRTLSQSSSTAISSIDSSHSMDSDGGSVLEVGPILEFIE